MESLLKLATLFKLATKYYGKKASGMLFVCLNDNTLFLTRRSKKVHNPGVWGIPGGAMAEEGEGFHEAEEHKDPDPPIKEFHESAQRETSEELRSLPKVKKLIDTATYRDGNFTYKTFIYEVSKKAKDDWNNDIVLNWENDKAMWFNFDELPENIHPGVKVVIQKYLRIYDSI